MKKESKETIAQEALRLLSPIPEKRWCKNVFINPSKTKCCALGHWHRLKRANGKYNFQGYEVQDYDLRRPSLDFLKEKYGLHETIASVNNSPDVNNYTQKSIKSRVIALLKDMVKAGL